MAESLTSEASTLFARLYAGQEAVEPSPVDSGKTSPSLTTDDPGAPRMYLSMPADYGQETSKMPLTVHPSDPVYARIYRSLTLSQDGENPQGDETALEVAAPELTIREAPAHSAAYQGVNLSLSQSAGAGVALQLYTKAGMEGEGADTSEATYPAAGLVVNTTHGTIQVTSQPLYQTHAMEGSEGPGQPHTPEQSTLLQRNLELSHSRSSTPSQQALYQAKALDLEVSREGTPPALAGGEPSRLTSVFYHTRSIEMSGSRSGTPVGSQPYDSHVEVDTSRSSTPGQAPLYCTRTIDLSGSPSAMPVNPALYHTRSIEVDLNPAASPAGSNGSMYEGKNLEMDLTKEDDTSRGLLYSTQSLVLAEPAAVMAPPASSATMLYQTRQIDVTGSPLSKPVYITKPLEADTAVSYQVQDVSNIKMEPARSASPALHQVVYQTKKLAVEPGTLPTEGAVMYQAVEAPTDASQAGLVATHQLLYQGQVLDTVPLTSRTDTPPQGTQILYTRDLEPRPEASPAPTDPNRPDLDLKTVSTLVHYKDSQPPTTEPPAYASHELGEDLTRGAVTLIDSRSGVGSVAPSTSLAANLLDPSLLAELLYHQQTQTVVASKADTTPDTTTIYPPPTDLPHKPLSQAELSALYKSHGLHLDLKQPLSASDLQLLTAALYASTRPQEPEPPKVPSELAQVPAVSMYTARTAPADGQPLVSVAGSDAIYGLSVEPLELSKAAVLTGSQGTFPAMLYMTSPTGAEKDLSKMGLQVTASDRSLGNLYATLPAVVSTSDETRLSNTAAATAAALETMTRTYAAQDAGEPGKTSPTRNSEDLFARLYTTPVVSRDSDVTQDVILTTPDNSVVYSSSLILDQSRVTDATNTTLSSQIYTSPPTSRDLDPNKLMELIAQDNLFRKIYGNASDTVVPAASKTDEQNVADTLAQRMYTTPNSQSAGLTDLFATSTSGQFSPTGLSSLKVSAPVSQQGLYQCWICYATFNQETELISHLNVHTDNKQLKCGECGQSYPDSIALEEHCKTHTQVECTFCKQKFSQQTALDDHMNTHKAELPHQCILCKKRFAVAANLVDHMKSHTLEKNLECDICHKKFGRPNHLQVHKKTHSGERPHECHICGKKFTRSHVLRDHLTIHTGEKRYGCEICGKKFTGGNDLKRHLRTHTGEKPYECILCKKTFAQSSHLKDHMRVHMKSVDMGRKQRKPRRLVNTMTADVTRPSVETVLTKRDVRVRGNVSEDDHSSADEGVEILEEGIETEIIMQPTVEQPLAAGIQDSAINLSQSAALPPTTELQQSIVFTQPSTLASTAPLTPSLAQDNPVTTQLLSTQPKTLVETLMPMDVHNRLLQEVRALDADTQAKVLAGALVDVSQSQAQLQAKVLTDHARTLMEVRAHAKALSDAQALLEAQAKALQDERARIEAQPKPVLQASVQLTSTLQSSGQVETNITVQPPAPGGVMTLPVTIAEPRVLTGSPQPSHLPVSLVSSQPAAAMPLHPLTTQPHQSPLPQVQTLSSPGMPPDSPHHTPLPSMAAVHASLPSTTLADLNSPGLPTMQTLTPATPTLVAATPTQEPLPGAAAFHIHDPEVPGVSPAVTVQEMDSGESGIFQCWVCFKRFQQQLDLASHISVHVDQRGEPPKCEACDKAFNSLEELKEHAKTHVVNEKPFECEVCHRTFSRSYHLKDHMNTHTGSLPFECHICHQKFLRASSLAEHRKMHGPQAAQRDCHLCNKSFSSPQHLNIHMRTHTGERPYSCNTCGKSFTRSHVLKEHMYTHTGERPHACCLCPKRFAGANDLRRHMRTHTGERPYACDQCNKTFVQSSHLKDHRRMHMGEKTHKCPICSKKFLRPYDVKIHARIHTGERPYQCVLCKKGFTQSCGLKTHMRTHASSVQEPPEGPRGRGRPKGSMNKTHKKPVSPIAGKRPLKKEKEAEEPPRKMARLAGKRQTRPAVPDEAEDSGKEADEEEEDSIDESSLPPKRRGRGHGRKAVTSAFKLEEPMFSPVQDNSEGETSKDSPEILDMDEACLPPKRRGRGRPRKAKHTAKALGGLSEPKGDLQPMLIDTNTSLSDGRSPSDGEDAENAALAKQINNVLAGLQSDDDDDDDPPDKTSSSHSNSDHLMLQYSTKPILQFSTVQNIRDVKHEKESDIVNIIPSQTRDSTPNLFDKKSRLLPRSKPSLQEDSPIGRDTNSSIRIGSIMPLVSGTSRSTLNSISASLNAGITHGKSQVAPLDYHKTAVPTADGRPPRWSASDRCRKNSMSS